MTNTNFDIKPLSAKDRNKLRKQYIFAVLFLLCASAIFSFIYFFVIKPDNFSTIPIVIFTLFLLFFVGIISYIFRNTYIDLKRGIKHCYTGTITDKRVDKYTSKSRNYNRSKGADKRHKSTRNNFYISIDNQEHSVPYLEYAKININDKVYLESSPKSEEVLAFTILEKNQNNAAITNNNKHSVPFKSESFTKPMQQNDIALVEKIFFKKVRLAFVYLAAYTILLFLLWKGIFIFLIPLIVAFIYTSIKTLILLIKFAKFNRNGKLKEVTTAQVTDKLTLTSNRNATIFRLVTNVETIDVSEKIYTKAKVNDSIELHKATFFKSLLGVGFNEGTQYLQNL